MPLSDSTHGAMTHFELITVCLRDGCGAGSAGQTYTGGTGGGAIHAPIDHGLRPVLIGTGPNPIEAV